MKDKKFDVFHMLFSSYSLDILKELEKSGPKRFMDLKRLVRSEQTLSIKLEILLDNKIIEFAPILTQDGYVNGYRLSAKGKAILARLDKLMKDE